jgi:IS5 family transposase
MARQLDQVRLPQRKLLDDLLARTGHILTQQSKDKFYALHAPEVACIAEGKARTLYEFGVKVSIVTALKEGLVVRARFRRGIP